MATKTARPFGEQLIDHVPSLRRYARSLAGAKDQADDLVQDCLERALSCAALFQPDTNLRAWLFTIMRNITITQARKEKLRRQDVADRKAMAVRFRPPSQIDMTALIESLALIERLSSTEHEAVTLLGVQDLSYEEAAQITGLPVGTMKSRLSRGRQHLRSMSEAIAPARSVSAADTAHRRLAPR